MESRPATSRDILEFGRCDRNTPKVSLRSGCPNVRILLTGYRSRENQEIRA